MGQRKRATMMGTFSVIQVLTTAVLFVLAEKIPAHVYLGTMPEAARVRAISEQQVLPLAIQLTEWSMFPRSM